jgi:hypothetical protein
LNTEELVNYLTEKDFNDKQINQLVKIQEAGYDLIEYIDIDGGSTIRIIEDKYITPDDDIEKLRRLKDILINDKYDNSQLTEIIDGFYKNLNYDVYATKIYNGRQMYSIRLGLEDEINVTKYCDDKYNSSQLERVVSGLKDNINILDYCDYTFDGFQMYEILDGLINKIDVTQYNNIKYDDNQMEILKDILIFNKEKPRSAIDISLFQNENISPDEMDNLFNMLISQDSNEKIEAYKILNQYKEVVKNNINNELDR